MKSLDDLIRTYDLLNTLKDTNPSEFAKSRVLFQNDLELFTARVASRIVNDGTKLLKIALETSSL